jgi:hypothetical protein
MAIICQYPRTLLFSFLLVAVEMVWSQTPAPVWRGVLQDDNAQHIAQASVKLDAGSEHKETSTDPHGVFLFDFLVPKTYHVSVDVNGRVYRSSAGIKIPAQAAPVTLTLQADGGLVVAVQQEKAPAGGEQLTSKAVSEIPLNKRDFGQLLLLAAAKHITSESIKTFVKSSARRRSSQCGRGNRSGTFRHAWPQYLPWTCILRLRYLTREWLRRCSLQLGTKSWANVIEDAGPLNI